jgi:hypothetical protein
MKYDFIAWMILYPIGEQVVSYLHAKRRREDGKKPYDDGVVATSSLFHILIWAGIGFLLW